ncbi:nucleoid-associated protein [Clostridium estertheticum]|uniref:nucleoid-associated protein n=1 Tax=Clostridium estertheticum TaxID=238834 RepID=UPI001C7CCDEF|nr:nucleoid-associated protein [Clostridium estertheticum]MBX4266582.1 nucleoid-associated protein [Clostridium estertheticum]WLC88080.1 nucleoid-associated protein [Clostridium estertheticum]
MEYIKEININEAVIHVLDNNSDVPILNEYALDLNEDMYNILLKLIKKGLNDEKLRYALFNDCTGLVMDQTKKYLNGENNLLYISKEIAKELFSLMRSNGGIPSCDFITVSFTTEFGPLLGLFKMDYIKNYTHSIEIIDNKMSIDVIAQMSSLSDKVQKIQKCAFIKAFREENTFDLMVIDNQSKNKVDEEYGSTYFTSNFLKCDLVNNERDMTKNFIAATERYARTNFREDASKQEMFRKDVKRQLEEKDSINVKEFAENIFEDNGDLENFNEYMEKYDVAETVAIDKEYIAKKLKKTRLKIDGGIEIYIDEDAYNDKSQFEVQRNGDGTINMVIKHISNYIEK